MEQRRETKSLTERTCDDIRNAIVYAKFEPGQKLRIDALASQFNASSGVVREVLSRLTAEGLVNALPQRGFTVAPMSLNDLKELTEARIDLELTCLQRSIEYGDTEWETQVLSAIHRLVSEPHPVLGVTDDVMTRRSAPSRWHLLHEDFHSALTSACGNRWWLLMRKQLYTQSERYRRLSTPMTIGNRDINSEHQAIADATLARDSAKACELLEKHLMRTTDLLLQSPIFALAGNRG